MPPTGAEDDEGDADSEGVDAERRARPPATPATQRSRLRVEAGAADRPEEAVRGARRGGGRAEAEGGVGGLGVLGRGHAPRLLAGDGPAHRAFP